MLPKEFTANAKHNIRHKGSLRLLGVFACLLLILQFGLLSPAQAKKVKQSEDKAKSVISYVEGEEKSEDIPASMRAGLFTLTADSALIKHVGSARVNLESSNVVNLDKGETLVFSNKPTVVKTGSYDISVAPEAIVLVSNQGEIVKIRNLYEKISPSVTVHFNEKQTTLAAGQEILLGSSTDVVKKALKSDLIGRRQVHGLEFTHGPSIMKCEVSLLSLIQNVDILNKLMCSKNKEDRDIARRLVKMAAVVSQVTASHGAYTSIGF